MYQIRKTYHFEMAHQLSHAVSRACSATIHGHSYKAEVFLGGEELNDDGMVVDFGALLGIKSFFEMLDHALMLPTTLDPTYLSVLSRFNEKLILVDFNPTAEEIAKWALFKLTTTEFGHLVRCVRIHETDTGWAECYQEDEL